MPCRACGGVLFGQACASNSRQCSCPVSFAFPAPVYQGAFALPTFGAPPFGELALAPAVAPALPTVAVPTTRNTILIKLSVFFDQECFTIIRRDFLRDFNRVDPHTSHVRIWLSPMVRRPRWWETLDEQVGRMKARSVVFLAGDFNARVGKQLGENGEEAIKKKREEVSQVSKRWGPLCMQWEPEV